MEKLIQPEIHPFSRSVNQNDLKYTQKIASEKVWSESNQKNVDDDDDDEDEDEFVGGSSSGVSYNNLRKSQYYSSDQFKVNDAGETFGTCGEL